MNSDQFLQIIYNVSLVVMLWATMLGLGLRISVGELIGSATQTRLMMRGLVLNMVIIPLLVWGLTRVAAIEPAIAVGLVILAASGGGPFGLTATQLALGDTVFALALMSILQVARVITVPFWLGVALPFKVGDLVQVIIVLAGYILLPLAIGLVLRRFWLHRSDSGVRVNLMVAYVSQVVVIVSAILVYRAALAAIVFSWTAALILVIQLVSLGLGYLTGGPLTTARRALAVTAPVRSSATALLIATQVYGDHPLVAGTVAAYGVLALIVASLAALLMARMYSAERNVASYS